MASKIKLYKFEINGIDSLDIVNNKYCSIVNTEVTVFTSKRYLKLCTPIPMESEFENGPWTDCKKRIDN